MSSDPGDLEAAARAFALPGEPDRIERHGGGHIHDTYRVSCAGPAPASGLLLQRFNTEVFRDPAAVMDNVARVTAHLRAQLGAAADAGRRSLRPIPTQAGPLLHDTGDGCWRAFGFIEGARGYAVMTGPAQARTAARAFAGFVSALADLPPPRLRVTIPDFHDLGVRWAAFERACVADPRERASAAAPEIAALRRAHDATSRELAAVAFDALPRRVVHHDCKLDNLLFDAATDEALCVIDFDTVMEGSVLSDFGELVRTGTCSAPEDARDLDAVRFDPTLFEALARGYVAGAAHLLTPEELRALPLAGPLLTLMNAVRFLTDHLAGDVYFRVHREGHNLQRARAQQRLWERMREADSEVRARLGAAREELL